MEIIIWSAAAGGVLLLAAAALWFAPAHTTIVVDTPTSIARADIGLLWGMGPRFSPRALPPAAAGAPFAMFNEAARIGQALMTPGIADAVYEAVRQLFAFKPRVAKIELGVNLGDNAQNLVVQTAAQAALAAAPASVRERVVIAKCEAPGAELAAHFELYASPAQLSAIYGRLKTSRAVREFRKRLNQKPKPSKKAPREVRAS